jgi:hypothetical protein
VAGTELQWVRAAGGWECMVVNVQLAGCSWWRNVEVCTGGCCGCLSSAHGVRGRRYLQEEGHQEARDTMRGDALTPCVVTDSFGASWYPRPGSAIGNGFASFCKRFRPVRRRRKGVRRRRERRKCPALGLGVAYRRRKE